MSSPSALLPLFILLSTPALASADSRSAQFAADLEQCIRDHAAEAARTQPTWSSACLAPTEKIDLQAKVYETTLARIYSSYGYVGALWCAFYSVRMTGKEVSSQGPEHLSFTRALKHQRSSLCSSTPTRTSPTIPTLPTGVRVLASRARRVRSWRGQPVDSLPCARGRVPSRRLAALPVGPRPVRKRPARQARRRVQGRLRHRRAEHERAVRAPRLARLTSAAGRARVQAATCCARDGARRRRLA